MDDTVTVPAELFEVAVRLAHHMGQVADCDLRGAQLTMEVCIDNARNVLAEGDLTPHAQDLCARWNELRAKYGYADMRHA